MLKRVLCCALVALATLLSGAQLGAQADVDYELIDLGPAEVEGSPRGALNAINEAGVAVGFVGVETGRTSPIIVRNGLAKKIESGTYGATFSDINNAGVIVGREVTGREPDGTPVGLPAMWIDEEQTLLELPVDYLFGEAVQTGVARAINDAGVIVGTISFTQYNAAVMWIDGVPSMLPNAFGFENCEGWGVSERGVASGACFNPEVEDFQAVVWEGGAPIVLPANGYAASVAVKVEDSGASWVAVGYSWVEPGTVWTEASTWTAQEARLLPAPGGMTACAALGMARSGSVVGGCSVSPYEDIDVDEVGVIWDTNGGAVDINALLPADTEMTLISANLMNGDGVFGGLGLLDGVRHIYLMVPAEG